MRNSKAKQIIGRKEEILQRRNGRARSGTNHKVKSAWNGRFNSDGTPQTVTYHTSTLFNNDNFYKLMKRNVFK